MITLLFKVSPHSAPHIILHYFLGINDPINHVGSVQSWRHELNSVALSTQVRAAVQENKIDRLFSSPFSTFHAALIPSCSAGAWFIGSYRLLVFLAPQISPPEVVSHQNLPHFDWSALLTAFFSTEQQTSDQHMKDFRISALGRECRSQNPSP